MKFLSKKITIVLFSTVYALGFVSTGTTLRAQGTNQYTSIYSISSINNIQNKDGEDPVDVYSNPMYPSSVAWFGNGRSKDSSYLGLLLKGNVIPVNAKINSAKIAFNTFFPQWIGVSFDAYLQINQGAANSVETLNLTNSFKSYSENKKWLPGEEFVLDLTEPFSEAFAKSSGESTYTLILKGTGESWGRMFFIKFNQVYGPKLIVGYTSENSPADPPSSPSAVNSTPGSFQIVSPISGTSDSPINSLRMDWSDSIDPDNDPVTYSLYMGAGGILGQAPNIQLVTSGINSSEYTLTQNLAYNTPYVWYVVASDGIASTTSNSGKFNTMTRPNSPPIVNAGVDQNVVSNSVVTLDGSASYDQDGDSLGFIWAQLDGPSVVLQNPNSQTTTFTAPTVNTPTTFTFRLWATDTQESVTDTILVTVNP